MDLESVTQSEVSQKKQYCVLKHGYATQKTGTDEPIPRVGIETQMYRTDM